MHATNAARPRPRPGRASSPVCEGVDTPPALPSERPSRRARTDRPLPSRPAAGPCQPSEPRATRRIAVAVVAVAAAAVATLSGAPGADAVAGASARTLAAQDSSSYTTTGMNVADTFDRRVRTGLGGAPRGGRYAMSPSRTFSVKGSVGRLAPLRRGTAARATLNSVSALNEVTRATFSLNRRPARGGVWLAVETRRQSTNSAYRTRVKVAANGRLTLDIVQTARGVERPVSGRVTLPSRLLPGQPLSIESYVTGSGDTAVTLRARAWVNASVPAWQLTSVQRGLGRISRGGAVGIWAYTSRSSASPAITVRSLYGWAMRQLNWSTPAQPIRPGPVGPEPSNVPTITPPTTTTPPVTPPTRTPPVTPPPTTAPPTTTPPVTPPTSEPPTTTPGTTTPPTTTPPTTTPPTTTPPTTTPPTTTPPTTPPTSNGATFPGPDNTGVPSVVTLRPYYGDLRITTPGAVYDGLDIHGFVYVRAANVTIRNSIVRGGQATGNLGLVNVDNRSTGFRISDSELVPEYPSVWIDGIKGWNYSAVRVNIHGTVDGAKAYGDNVLIQDSWIHDTAYYASDPNQGGGPTHNDGIQVLSGGNLVFVGNNIQGGGNAALQVTQGNGVVRDMTFNGNLVGGGGCSVNIATKPLTSMSNIVLNDNRFQRTSTYNCAMIIDKTVVYTANDNMFMNDTKQANVIYRG